MSKEPVHTTPQLLTVAIIIGIASVLCYLLLFIFSYVSSFAVLGMGYLDSEWLQRWYTIRTPFLTDFMFVITLFGADLTIIFGTIATYFFKRAERKREAMIFGTAGLIGFILSITLKLLFARPRPEISMLVPMDSFSYPSGHSMNGFIFYGLLAYYLIAFTKRELLEVIVAVISVTMILLIGASRIYLGVHYPTDVLAGYVAGLCVVVAAIYINNLYLKRKEKR